MEVRAQLHPEVAETVSSPEGRTPKADAVLEVVSKLGMSLEALHPGHSDPQLRTHYRVEAPDEQTADQVREALAGLEGVEAAYLQPPDALP